jgi:hypothetical protein
MEEINATNIHAELAKVMTKDEIDHHYSNLYVKRNAASKEIIERYQFKNLVTTFKDQITKTTWYDIPFAYDSTII